MTVNVPPLRSRVGMTVIGDNRFRGFSVKDEITGTLGTTGLLVLALTGRLPPAEDVAILDDLAASHSSCDPRIPPIKLARVVASFGACVTGLAAGDLGFTGEDIGAHAGARCAQLLLDIAERLPSDHRAAIIEAEVKRRLAGGERIPGFGAAMRPSDERVVAFRRSLDRRGLIGRPWFRLADELAACVHAAGSLQPNGALYGGAAFLEVGLHPDQMPIVAMVLFQHAFAGVVYEGAIQDEAQLRRLPVECVCYKGPAPRQSPRARAAARSAP